MPGIYGIVASRDVAWNFRDDVRRAHAIPGISFRERFHESGNCSLLSFARVSAPATDGLAVTDPRTGSLMLLEGELLGMRSSDRDGTRDDAGQLRDLLEAYLARGDGFLEPVDGEFNIVVYEPGAERLSIFTDRAGSQPFYYWHAGGDLIFGTEKKCLLAASGHPRSLDSVGLLQPFVHQHNLEERTLVEGLRRIRPATRLTFESGRVRTSEYGQAGAPAISRGRPQELLAHWEHELKAATARRLAGKSKLLISLSAGQDSRAVACAIDRSKRPIAARTWGHADSFEVRYAKEIARVLHFDHHVENPFDFTLSDGVRRIVWRTDGETDFRNGLSMFTHAAMRPLADDVIGGWLGDITSGAHLRPFMLLPMNRGKFIGRVFNWYIQHRYDDLRQVFTKEFLDRNWPGVRQAFVESYRRFDAMPNTRAHEAWDLQNRQARMTVSSMPVDSHLFGKVRPFFDRSYLAFTATIPVRWRIGQTLYKALIARIGPEIRDIPNGNTNVRNFLSPYANLTGYGRTLGDKVIAKAMSKVRAGPRRPGGAGVAADLARHDRADAGMRRLLEGFLASRYCDGSIFDRAAIGRMLEAHYSGSADRSELIAILASYAVALEYFYYERTMGCPPDAQPYL